MDKELELKKQIIAEAKPLIDKLNALSQELGEAEELENGPSSGVRQYLADEKRGLFKGKPLTKEKEAEFTETGDFTGKKI